MRLRVREHILEAVDHDALKPLVDLSLGPEITHAVLHPLEVTGRDAAGVGQDVWDNEDTLRLEDFVSDDCCGAVRALAEDPALELRRVLAGDDVFGRGGDEDLAWPGQQLGLVNRDAAGKAVDGAGLLAMVHEDGDVEAIGIGQRAVVLGQPDDGVALVEEDLRRV